MIRLLLWGFVIYFIVRVIQLWTRVKSYRPPTMPPPPASSANSKEPFKNIEDADFEDITPPPDPPK